MKIVTSKLLLVSVLLTALVGPGEGASAEEPRDDRVPSGETARALAEAFRRAADNVGPSVVTIETYSGPRETREWARRAAGKEVEEEGAMRGDILVAGARNGVGTGIVFDERGYILTCNHVVREADMAFVRLGDGRRFEVTKILQDPFTDVAVVEIENAGPLRAAELAEGDDLAVGDWVVTIGNPYGLGVSLTAGVVSAKNRHLRHSPYAGLIQTDAATNPGNSGGALVNLAGEVVGMSEGGYGVVEGFQGIGFAIPIDLASRVGRELIDKGKVNRPFLGIETEIIPVDIARHLGLDAAGGVIVCDVAPRSPAARGGIQVGDVLTHVNGSAVPDHFEFFRVVDKTPEGAALAVTIFRDGKSLDIDVVPTTASPPLGRTGASVREEDETAGFFDKELGVVVDEVTRETAKELGYRAPIEGLLITHVEPQSVAAKQGICAGMSLVKVDGAPIRSVADYQGAAETRDLAKGALLLLGTPRQKHFVLCKK